MPVKKIIIYLLLILSIIGLVITSFLLLQTIEKYVMEQKLVIKSTEYLQTIEELKVEQKQVIKPTEDLQTIKNMTNISTQNSIIINDKIKSDSEIVFPKKSDKEKLSNVIHRVVLPRKRSSSKKRNTDKTKEENDDSENNQEDNSQNDENNNLMNQRNQLSVYIYTYTINSWDPQELAQACMDLGVTKVILSTNSTKLSEDEGYEERIANIISELHKKKIIVAGLFLESLSAYNNSNKVNEFFESFLNYQNLHSLSQKYDELSFDLEPHAIREELGYNSYQGNYWNSNNGYGIGNSNDLLLEKTIDILSNIRELYPGKISQANTVWFQEIEMEGKVAHGKVSHFLEEVDEIILMDYSTNQEDIISRVVRELKDSNYEKSITVCLSTERNAPSSSSFYKKTYGELLETRENVVNELSSYNSFAGMCNFDFGSLYELYTK